MKVEAVEGRAGGGAFRTWLLARLTNIAPLVTLFFLIAIFSAMAPSFSTLDNVANIMR